MAGVLSWQALTSTLVAQRSVPVTVEVTRRMDADRFAAVSVVGLEATDGLRLVDTVSAGLRKAGFDCDWSGLRVTVRGHTHDAGELGLALAAALLAATGQGSVASLAASLYLGGVGADGSVLPVRGILAHLSYARTHGLTLVCAMAPYVSDVPWNVRHIVSSVSELRYRLVPAPGPIALMRLADAAAMTPATEVHGCAHAKRAACVSLAGGHALALVCDRPSLTRAFVRGMQEMALPLPVSRRHDVALARSVAGLARGQESRGIRPLVRVGTDGADAVPADEALALARHGILFLECAGCVDEAFLDDACSDANVLIVVALTRDEVRNQTPAARRALSCADIVCGLCERDVDMRVPACWARLAEVVRQSAVFSARRRERLGKCPSKTAGEKMRVHKLVDSVVAARGLSLASARHRVASAVARTIADLARSQTVEEAHVVEALALVMGGIPRQ